MSLYNRSYMREDFYGGQSRKHSALLWIIGVTLVFYLLDGLFRRPYFGAYLELSYFSLQSYYLWTFLTYGLLHGGFFHFFINMFILFIFGNTVESRVGSIPFLGLYVAGVLLGGIVHIVFNFEPSPPLVGASAGVSAVFCVFCLSRFNETINLMLMFVLPVQIKGKWLLAILGGLDLVGFLLNDVFGTDLAKKYVAHGAHVGGYVAGFAFFIYFFGSFTAPGFSVPRFLEGPKRRIEMPAWLKRGRKVRKAGGGGYTVNISRRADASPEEVNRILDKISEKGFESISPKEREILERHSQKRGR